MYKQEPIKSISKILSSNDIGQTGAHQAGMHIPKKEDILSFFPTLNPKQKNPRFMLVFTDDNNVKWEFSFIYYNNQFFGGTRNEYRLTRMTKYLKSNNLKVGNELILLQEENGEYRVSCIKKQILNDGKLKLSTEWKIITIKNKP